jgi:predicted RND superfamily exporter protein
MRPILPEITRRPFWSLLGVLVVTGVAIAGLIDPRTGEPRLQIDPSLARLRSAGDESHEFYEYARKLFGDDETLLVALHTENVFTPENLRRVVRITERIGRLEGVREVLSLATAVDLWSVGDEIEIGPFLSDIPTEREGLDRLRERVRSNPIYGPTLVSPDGRSAAFVISFRGLSDQEYRESGLDETIASIAREEAGDAEVWLTGAPHVEIVLGEAMVRNLGRILPSVLLVLALVPLLAFRSVVGVVLPLLTIVVSLVWTLGTLGWIGQPLNVVTTIVPPLILTVGFAYAIHVVSAYADSVEELRPRTLRERAEAAHHALKDVGVPVAVTGITTAAGLIALTLSPVKAVREFGWLAVLGVLFTVAVSLTLTPALLALTARRMGRRSGSAEGPFGRFAGRLAKLDLEYRTFILAGGIVALVLALVGATRIRANSDYVENWPPASGLPSDYRAINERFGGASLFYIVLETDVPDAFMEPANLQVLQSLQGWLEAQPEIGETASIADYLMLLNRGLHDDDPAYLRIPGTKRLAKQLLFFGSTPETEAFIDGRYQTANLMVRTRLHDSAGMRVLADRIREYLGELPKHLRGKVTGGIVLFSQSIDDIARGQAQSLAAAVLGIYLILSIMFSSLRVGLVALFPNVLPIAIYFGLLGFSGIYLNTTTSLVGCIALGIAVDDTVHYFARFNADAKRKADEQAATQSALQGVIRPVSFTTLALCAGFLVFLSSEFQSQAEFGALAAFTLAAAWAVDVTLTPALCSGFRIVTLWDVLTLDLGRDPHRSIPLFEGLSVRQARMVALMAHVRDCVHGIRLMTEGAEEREMYVVIEGTLVASVTHNGHRTELAKMTRGDVVGEVALFAQRRTADVDAETDCRLLAITGEDLDRLRARYPRIATQVFWNLNRVLASRVAQTTRRLK